MLEHPKTNIKLKKNKRGGEGGGEGGNTFGLTAACPVETAALSHAHRQWVHRPNMMSNKPAAQVAAKKVTKEKQHGDQASQEALTTTRSSNAAAGRARQSASVVRSASAYTNRRRRTITNQHAVSASSCTHNPTHVHPATASIGSIALGKYSSTNVTPTPSTFRHQHPPHLGHSQSQIVSLFL